MPRQGRIDIVGGIYHLIGRGINREVIFKDNDVVLIALTEKKYINTLSDLLNLIKRSNAVVLPEKSDSIDILNARDGVSKVLKSM